MDAEICEPNEREHGGGCHSPAGGRLRGFIQPRILLELLEEPGHGYALLDRLNGEFRTAQADAGLLYRTLRHMEREGLLVSRWETDGQGPARRAYEVTPEGVHELQAWAERISDTRVRLERFLERYHDRFGGD